ncbi:MAG: ATP synthase F0 subunit B [Cyanobacteria bacterium]|jgi:F-type H+-transporting ATPase subunit b|nr:ATP synthase F0 subunit B [Cyanobacteriota bacterium]
MLSIDGTFIFILASFVIFMLLMRSLFFEPIRQIKAEREQKISGDKLSAEEFSKTFENLSKDFELKLKEARQKAHRLISEASESAKKEAASQLSQSREEARNFLDTKMVEIAEQREATYRDLASDRLAFVQSIIEKITLSDSSHLFLQTTTSRES